MKKANDNKIENRAEFAKEILTKLVKRCQPCMFYAFDLDGYLSYGTVLYKGNFMTEIEFDHMEKGGERKRTLNVEIFIGDKVDNDKVTIKYILPFDKSKIYGTTTIPGEKVSDNNCFAFDNNDEFKAFEKKIVENIGPRFEVVLHKNKPSFQTIIQVNRTNFNTEKGRKGPVSKKNLFKRFIEGL